MVRTSLTSNTANLGKQGGLQGGGGLCAYDMSSVQIESSSFINNSAGIGGGIYIEVGLSHLFFKI